MTWRVSCRATAPFSGCEWSFLKWKWLWRIDARRNRKAKEERVGEIPWRTCRKRERTRGGEEGVCVRAAVPTRYSPWYYECITLYMYLYLMCNIGGLSPDPRRALKIPYPLSTWNLRFLEKRDSRFRGKDSKINSPSSSGFGSVFSFLTIFGFLLREIALFDSIWCFLFIGLTLSVGFLKCTSSTETSWEKPQI